ncbi:AAA family ATPase [Tropicibacter alexandrii]|uniref:AAA family ATPase n=1 Tax=Tropicibacter alexandrii TaxID=2267683 RepID=UPI001F0C95F6|nr:ATP-binding protein [Tropicibacter alexandrii]
MSSKPMLHMLCGKIAAGKSTLAATLSAPDDAILIAEDRWLAALFGDQMQTGQDYVRFSGQLRTVIGLHVTDLLRSGLTVVMDFPANTVDQRAWLREVADTAGAAHLVHVLDVPDAVCLKRLKARNARGDHPFAVTEAQFHRFSAHFVWPTAEEGLSIVTVS